MQLRKEGKFLGKNTFVVNLLKNGTLSYSFNYNLIGMNLAYRAGLLVCELVSLWAGIFFKKKKAEVPMIVDLGDWVFR